MSIKSIFSAAAWVAILCGLSAFSSASPAASGRPRVGLVLSGGGARGGAHIGVLKKLEEAGVPIDVVSGTSFGALVGSLYAVGYSASDIELIIQRVDWNQLFDDSPDRRLLNFDNKRRSDRRLVDLQFEQLELKLPVGLRPGQKARQLFDRLTVLPTLEADNDFDRLPVRFRAVATNILTGQAHVFKSGSMGAALRASIAVPGLFTPVEEGDALLVDGGLADNLPVAVAFEAGAELVIAVDVSTPLKSRKSEIRSVLDVLDQAISIHIEENKAESLQQAHIVITPDLEEFSSSDFASAADVIERGYQAADRSLPVIEQLLAENGIALGEAAPRARRLDPARFDLASYQWSDGGIAPGEVRTEGLRRYPQAARELIREGLPESLEGVDKKVSMLYGTDLFEEVSYQFEKRGQETLLVFEFQESAPTRVGLGLRYDRDYDFTGALDLVSRDVLGSRSDLSFRALVGDARLAELGLDAPTVSAHQLIFSPRVYFRANPRTFFDGDEEAGEFVDERAGFWLGVRYLLNNRGQIEAGYRLDRVNIARGAGAFGQRDPETVATLRVGARLDSLDSLSLPTSGWAGQIFAEVAESGLGGDHSYVKLSAKGVRHFAVDGRSTLGVSGNWGLVEGDPPFFDRFYVGGAQYLAFSAEPFVGLRRDEIVADHFVTAGVSYRRIVKDFQLGLLKSVSLGGEYQAGLFNRDDRLSQFRSLLHGFGGGLYLDTRFLGALKVSFGGTDRGDFNAYVSVGPSF